MEGSGPVASRFEDEGGGSAGASSRVSFGWVREQLCWRPVVILLAVGVALRAATLPLYFPGVLLYPDEARFARAAEGFRHIFDDYWMPAAYPMFLAGLRLLTDQLWFAIAAQHLLGVVAGTALYLAMRRLEMPRWVALIPAAVYLLDGDVLYLEHTLLADQFALALTTLALCAAIFGLRPRIDLRWLAVAGALAAGAWLTRSPFLLVVIVIVATAVIVAKGAAAKADAGGVAAAGAAVVVVLFVLAFTISDGRYLGLSDMRGWNLYGRVMPFADCSRFDVPEQSRLLCDRRPPSARPGPFSYVWFAYARLPSVPQRPTTDDQMWDFATSAIRAQPKDYASAVIGDLARYVHDPDPPARPYNGFGTDLLSFGWRSPYEEAIVREQLATVYDGTEVSAPGADLLGRYQDVARLHGVLVVALLLLTLAGAIFGRGPGRLGVALFGSTSLLLYLAPTATIGYDFRYAVTPSILLACAGTLGAYALWLRRSGDQPVEEG